MTATTLTEKGVLHRNSISLPLFRPVPKPPPAAPRVVQPNGAEKLSIPVPVSSPPQTKQSVSILDLDLLGKGDKVVIRTANSSYNFEMRDHHFCRVIPEKSPARSGDAMLMGGTNADASEYTPARVLVGGRAAYQFPDEDAAILTSVVESIFWVVAAKSGSA
jgi:hypothetical protein